MAFLEYRIHRNLHPLRIIRIGCKDRDIFLALAQYERVTVGVLCIIETLGKNKAGILLRLRRMKRENILHAIARETNLYVHTRT